MEAPSPSEPQSQDDGGANIKETLESILVAFILAFIFRCFVVEAFVIPTGSMAPTLLGAHSRFQCPDCGYRFDVNYSSPRNNDDDTEIPVHVPPIDLGNNKTRNVVYDDIHCPNCGLRLPPETSPGVWYGDRILVLKYLYLLQDPQRWDVVVFKSPSERAKDYSINFIKRLIGKPGETIMVLDGDIYVKAKGSDHFEIARKTSAAQEAMWRILYDNDYHPEQIQPRDIPWRQPWIQTAGDSKWNTEAVNGRVFTCDAGTSPATLTYNDDINRPANKNFGFADWIAYDQQHIVGTSPGGAWGGSYPVSDLKLDLYYSRKAGEGPLKLRLTKLGRAFTAEIGAHSAKLSHDVDGKTASATKSADLSTQANTPIHVEFTNVDYRVTLRINGRDVLQTTDADYHPDIADLQRRQLEYNHYVYYPSQAGSSPFPTPSVSITAESQTCEVSHIGLWRDVYYTQKTSQNNQIHWASPEPSPNGNGGPIVLGDNEYFVMGDNSPMSYDARFWSDPIDLQDEDLHADAGRVPERFLMGKAFFVYWPAGFRPIKGAPGLIPNFGQMRFIR